MRKEPTPLSSPSPFMDKLRSKRTAATILLASAVLSACGGKEGAAKSDAEPTVTVTQVIDSQYDYVPSDQVPYLRDTDPSLEEIKEPAVLSSEQITEWQSGNPSTQTDIASYVIAPRISVAVHELYDAKKQGTTADISWLTSDEGAVEGLNEVADYFIGVSDLIDPYNGVDWFGFDLCRSYSQADLDTIDRCHPNNFPDGEQIDFSEGSPMKFAVERETSANSDLDEENVAYFRLYDSTVRLHGDTLVIEPIN